MATIAHATDKNINQKRIFVNMENGEDVIISTAIFNDQFNQIHVNFINKINGHKCDSLLYITKIRGIKKPCLYIVYKKNKYVLMEK